MHQNAPTTKSGTCPCTPLQALRLSKKWLDGPLQNEEPATKLGVFSTKSRHPTPCFLVHSYDFQKHWPLQSGEPGMSKHLSRIATWKKENRQKYKGPFCRGMIPGFSGETGRPRLFHIMRDDVKEPWSPRLT